MRAGKRPWISPEGVPRRAGRRWRKLMRKAFMYFPAVIALAAGLSCATTPKVPEWVISTPPADGANTYFVGSASGQEVGTATADATSNLIAGIMQYMGVSVKVNTSATAKASLDAYSADIRQTVETQSANRLSGFKVTQKYLQPDKASGKITVHILASYATSELNKEKARIAALFQERADAVAKPEAEGDSLAAAGLVLDAAGKYMEAMAAASGSDIENAAIKLERNANKARAQVSSLSFTLGSGAELRGALGKAPARPLDIMVKAGKAGAEVPVPGAAIFVSYTRKLANGKLGSKTESLVTDASGIAWLFLPAPDFVGKGKVAAQLDLSSSLELLDKVGRQYDAILSSLEDEIRSKYAEIPYTVASAAASLPMALFVVDTDEKGFFSMVNAMQTGLMEALSKEGFSIRTLSMDPALAAAPVDAVLAHARGLAPEGTQRLAYGMGRIDSIRREGAFFVASASGSVKVVDIRTGQVLYAADKSWQTLASDEMTARRNALRELGSQVFGKDIVSSLP